MVSVANDLVWHAESRIELLKQELTREKDEQQEIYLMRQIGWMEETKAAVVVMRAALHDLAEKQARKAGCKRASIGTWKRSIQVAPVGQVAGLVNEAEQVDDRDHQQGSLQTLEFP